MKSHALTAKMAALTLAASLLISCGAPQASSQASDPAAEPTAEPVHYGAPTRLELTNPNFFGGEDGKYADEWLRAFTSDTGIEISVTVPSGAAMQEGYTAYLAKAASEGALTGLVYIENQQQLLMLQNAGVLQPLDGLIEANCNCTGLPTDFTDAFVYQGHTWAIPTAAEYTLPWVRSYDTAALAAAGVTAPATVGELSALAATSGGSIYAAGIAGLSDIFAAYGAPLGEQGSPLGYNAGCRNVVDAMLLPGAQDALTALRELYAAGGLNQDFLQANTVSQAAVMAAGAAGSCLAPIGTARYVYSMQRLEKAPKTVAEWQEKTAVFTDGAPLSASAAAVTSASVTYITAQAITAEVSGYCLIKGSEQAGEAVNWLLDTVLDEAMWQRLYLGGEQYYTPEEDGYVLAYRSKNSDQPVPTPGLTDCIEGLYNRRDHLRFYSDTTSLIKQTVREKAAYVEQTLSDGLQNGSLLYVSPRYYGIESAAYATVSQAVADAFAELLRAAVTDPNTTVAVALAEYRSTMAALGGDTILAEANAVYQLYPIQSYSAWGANQ